MADQENIPKRLYKYRRVDNRTLSMILNDQLFFANPNSFNDPLDCSPVVEIDSKNDQCETILRKYIRERVKDQLYSAAQTLEVQNSIIPDRIEEIIRREADDIIEDINNRSYDEYIWNQNEYEDEDEIKTSELKNRICVEVLSQYDFGIVSLSERESCPLMWSHYGDEHKGICVGYSMREDTKEHIHKVNYRNIRHIFTSQILRMLDGDENAKREVREVAILTKAKEWCYEEEWRLIGQRGSHNSTLELEEIIFGLRCPREVMFIIREMLKDRERPVKYYRMRQSEDSFELKKCPLTEDMEIDLSEFPIRHSRFKPEEVFGPPPIVSPMEE